LRRASVDSSCAQHAARTSKALRLARGPRKRWSVLTSKPAYILIVAVMLAMARQAHAQDATVLVVALAPPILLAPVLVTFGRLLWLQRGSQAPPRIVPLFLVSCVEVLLWLAFIGSVLVIITGGGSIRGALGLVIALGSLWMLSRLWIDSSRRAARWLFFASPPLILILLAAAPWLVIVTKGI
jgi:hypothetical protein